MHLFCSCVAVSNAWSWVQRQGVKWGQIGAGVDDWEILNLFYADSCHDTEIVWLVSSYVLYVWETVQVMKLEVKLDKFFGFLNFKYKMHQTTSKYQLQKDLLGISARGAEAIFSPPRERSACILQT